MTLAWAIIIVAVLFLLDKYHLLKKSLIATAVIAIVIIVGVAGWTGWRYLDARWEEHQSKVRLAKENALFAEKNECLNLYTGKVHPVNEPGSQTDNEYSTPVPNGVTKTPQIKVGEPVPQAGYTLGEAQVPQGAIIGGEGWTSIPPGGFAQVADEHWCHSNEVIHERGTPIDQWLLISEMPTVPPGEYRVINGKTDSDGIPTTASRLCIDSNEPQRCYAPPTEHHIFGLNAKAQDVKLASGGSLILFTAEWVPGRQRKSNHPCDARKSRWPIA